MIFNVSICSASLMLMLSCGKMKETTAELNWKLTKNHKHLGEGFYIILSNKYNKAKSYDGFQAPKYESSISLEREYSELEASTIEFETLAQKSNKLTILEKRTITAKDSLNGILYKLQNKISNKIQFQFIFENENKVYKLSAFYFTPLESKYDNIINKAIMSLVRGEVIITEDELQIAEIENNTIIYTRDGDLPTSSEDELVIKFISIDNFNSLLPKLRLEKSFQKLTGEDSMESYSQQSLENGKTYSAKLEAKDKKYYVRVISEAESNQGLLVECEGNSKLNFNELDLMLKRMFMKVVIE